MIDPAVPVPVSLPAIEWESVPCPLCGGTDSTFELHAGDLYCGFPGEFTFVRCQACGHVFLNPRPTPATIGLCYPADYLQHQPQTAAAASAATGRPWYARPPFRFIPGLRAFGRFVFDEGQHLIPAPPPQGTARPRALELGCAIGSFLRQLQQQGWEVEGLEPAEPAAARARAERLRVRTGLVENAEFAPATFDAIFAWMVVEHLHDPAGTLRKVWAALKPGGAFCFSVPNAGAWERHVFGRSWMGYDPPRHLQQFSPRTIRRLLTASGFNRIAIHHQRNIRYIFGSLAAGQLARRPHSRWGQTLAAWYRSDPPRWFHLLAFPLAWGLSLIGQGGRLTIVARKPD